GRGASVVGADLSAELPAGAEPVVTDIATPAGRAALVEATGPCNYLVIAHGIVRPRPIADTLEEDWDAILAVNAKAPYFICRDFGALLRAGGSVVTVSSVSARSAASLEQSVYSASKAALSSITRSFAHAYAPRGIRVNAILPGIVDTAMQEQFLAAAARARGTAPKELHEARLLMVPLRRTSSPRECAELILWLLGPASGYITGQQIAADGGLTMY